MFKHCKILLLAILPFIIVSCESQKYNLEGKYEWKYPHKIASSILVLNNDSTFSIFLYGGDIYFGHSSGHWTVGKHNQKLILNSIIQSQDDVIEVEEIRNKQIPKGSERISIYDTSNKSDFAYILADPPPLKDFTLWNALFVSKINIKTEKPLDSLAIYSPYVGHHFFYYNVKDKMANDFRIHFKLYEISSYVFLNNQEWQIKNGKLIDSDTAYHKFNRVYSRVNRNQALTTNAGGGLLSN